ATENESKSRGLGAESLKAITTGETIPIERKHEDPFDYTPNLKMIFLCNRPPKFTDWSGAMKRRMLIIPFKKQYVEDEPIFEYEGKINRNIADDLLKELPGILTWALEGWERLRGNNLKFTRSKKVNDYLKEYWLEHDHFEDFVTSCVTSCAGGKIKLNDLYRCVRAFLDENGMSAYAKSLTSRTITREIESTLKAKRIYFYRKDSGGARPFYEVVLNKKAKEYLRSSCMCQ
ncbi:DUF5906 domain-containing protein, partial [Synergistaceae bacterium OttesenSCG-928-I11]|nr:DUF5906 domain-containing protein [Synergistaceae bacterium OttesenSCG-928-I11]